ncbi:MAG TPA: hypothetical protein PK372_05740 [Rugosibacter sp.]|jgi:hypothetical protein|nr:hypothetical protein [Rugosibacter sp.]HQQ35412.1 hypothetical protein [Rugosibacter sp.]
MPQDPVDKSLMRMEARRFASRCESQIARIFQTNSLQEAVRLANQIQLSYPLSEESVAREALRNMNLQTGDRLEAIIRQQLQGYARVEPYLRDKWRRSLTDSWSHLTGSFFHLRAWANNRLSVIEQQLPE